MTLLQTSTAIVEISPRNREPHGEEIEALQSNRIDPKFLYATPRQAGLWRQVFLKHSPIHGNPEFTRIYREAFAKILDQLSAGKVGLVGLGCGTGLKELELYAALKVGGRLAVFSAVDVSRDLVTESAEKLRLAGAEAGQNLVCDLTQAPLLTEWLGRQNAHLPRLLTFFGLVPNLMPPTLAQIFRAVLRPGDVLLLSAHLAPVQHEGPEELAAAMEAVLPQYDNPETLAWLAAALDQWDLTERVLSPEVRVGQMNGIPAFLGEAQWKSSEPFEKWGQRFSPSTQQSLRLFYSLRYTPQLFEGMLRREGFDFDLLAVTSCRQEGIWSVRRGDGAMFQPPPT